MVKVELHTHTSDDPVDRIPYTAFELIDRAAALGYGALAITVHEKQVDVRPLASYAAARGVVLIPGIERSVEGRHVLLLNFDSGTEDVHTFDDVRRLKAAQPQGLVVAPHPFFPSPWSLFRLLNRNADVFDAVEYNAMYLPMVNFNLPAETWARRHQKPLVGGSDAHRQRQLGFTYSLVDAESEAASICQAIKAGRVRVVSRPLSWPMAISLTCGLIWASLIHGADAQLPRRTPNCQFPSPKALS